MWQAVWRPLAGGAATTVFVWALGMKVDSALVLGLAAATLTAVLQRVDLLAEPRPADHVHEVRAGARGEVLDLAWTMVGRDGRVRERTLRRLRESAARRVARHGLDLNDPDDAAASTALLGARAHATLTHRGHPQPTIGDLTHTLGVLERLGATRDDAAPPPGPDAVATPGRPEARDRTPASDTPPGSDPVPDPRSPR